MDVTPVNFIELRLYNTEEENEVRQFMDFVKRAYVESARAGLKNTFEKDRPIIKKLIEELNINIETSTVIISTGGGRNE